MREICQSGSEGGAKLTFVPTPILAQALAWVSLFLRASPRKGAGQCRGNPYRPHANADDYLLRPFSSWSRLL
jgi:hypothetical protein